MPHWLTKGPLIWSTNANSTPNESGCTTGRCRVSRAGRLFRGRFMFPLSPSISNPTHTGSPRIINGSNNQRPEKNERMWPSHTTTLRPSDSGMAVRTLSDLTRLCAFQVNRFRMFREDGMKFMVGYIRTVPNQSHPTQDDSRDDAPIHGNHIHAPRTFPPTKARHEASPP